jgi:hypothetical protein
LTVAASPASYEGVAGLTEEERQTYQQVSVKGLLLEQEKIPHPHVVQELHMAFRSPREVV